MGTSSKKPETVEAELELPPIARETLDDSIRILMLEPHSNRARQTRRELPGVLINYEKQGYDVARWLEAVEEYDKLYSD